MQNLWRIPPYCMMNAYWSRYQCALDVCHKTAPTELYCSRNGESKIKCVVSSVGILCILFFNAFPCGENILKEMPAYVSPFVSTVFVPESLVGLTFCWNFTSDHLKVQICAAIFHSGGQLVFPECFQLHSSQAGARVCPYSNLHSHQRADVPVDSR
ncbi:hypothetical protein Ancab_000362 [Ancistrocladus abbreviatus]